MVPKCSQNGPETDWNAFCREFRSRKNAVKRHDNFNHRESEELERQWKIFNIQQKEFVREKVNFLAALEAKCSKTLQEGQTEKKYEAEKEDKEEDTKDKFEERRAILMNQWIVEKELAVAAMKQKQLENEARRAADEEAPHAKRQKAISEGETSQER